MSLFNTTLAINDKQTSQKIRNIFLDAYENNTLNNYFREMRYLIKYAEDKQVIQEIWPITPSLMCYFLTYRLKDTSWSCFSSAWAGVTFCHRTAGIDITYLLTDPVLSELRKRVRKIYKPAQDIRDPILLEHYIAYAKKLGVNRANAQTIALFKLFKIVVAQFCGFVGTRGMELFPHKKTIRFLENQRTLRKDDYFIPNDITKKGDIKRKGIHGAFGKDVSWETGLKISEQIFDKTLKHYKIQVYSYKNKSSKVTKKEVILGRTGHKFCDPAYFCWIYQKRFLTQQHIKNRIAKNKLYIPNNYFFNWPDGIACTTDDLKNIFEDIKRKTEIPKELKITAYSARIGLATMMLQRGLSETDVYDYGAWARPTSASSMSGYARMPMKNKIKIPAFICFKKVKYNNLLFSPSEFHRHNNAV